MLEFRRDSKYAIILLHEIYGLNQHMAEVCKDYYDRGYDVFCPNLIEQPKPYQYTEQNEAYDNFNDKVMGKACANVKDISVDIRKSYKKIFLIGFSVGATIAWISSENESYDGLVGYYGSRIRDQLHIQPQCPSLLIFAEQEKSFNPVVILRSLDNKRNVTAMILKGSHGFMDRYSNNYNSQAEVQAKQATLQFLNRSII